MYVCMFLLSKAEVMYVCMYVCVDSLSRGDELHAAGKEGEDDDVIQSTLAITIHTYIHTYKSISCIFLSPLVWPTYLHYHRGPLKAVHSFLKWIFEG